MNYTFPKIALTTSQKQSIGAVVLVIVSAGYDALSKLSASPNAKLPVLVSALLPAVVIIAGAIKAALGRSLDKSRSGTGGGLIGDPEITLKQTAVAVGASLMDNEPELVSSLVPLFKSLTPADQHEIIADSALAFANLHKAAALNLSTAAPINQADLALEHAAIALKTQLPTSHGLPPLAETSEVPVSGSAASSAGVAGGNGGIAP